ncbi:glycosyltransferase family 4 protein [Roseomonas chloroacetimidivorans]|uniref:glycosyltransferase family 4 protein n=1 Tax=Roseomonas chloroacetimidivorans TaxID=1766656 RepID=UPI003C758D99
MMRRARGTEPLRILAAIVAPPHLHVSGAARAAEQLSEALSPYCDITVASMMSGSEESAPVRHLPVRCWLPPVMPWSRLPFRYSTLFYRSDLPRLVSEGDYDLVHLHNPMPAMEMERVARACISSRTPYVISTHGFNEIANGSAVYGFGAAKRLLWQRLVFSPVARAVRHADGIFALSPADAEIVAAMGFTGPVTVVSNGITTPQADDGCPDREILMRLGVPPERPPGELTCMFLANHTPNKGLPQLFEAFARLDRPFLLIVGGEQRDGVDYQGAIDACKPGRRIIVTGRLSDTEVGALFRRSDLFVFPSLADTLPLVVLEAMAHGLPVVASRVGGIPFQIAGGCGVLVPPGDSRALTAALNALADDPQQLLPMGNRARRRVLELFTWERAADQALLGYARALRLTGRQAAHWLPSLGRRNAH